MDRVRLKISIPRDRVCIFPQFVACDASSQVGVLGVFFQMLAVEALKEADGSLVVLSRIGGGSSQVGGWILGIEIGPLEGCGQKAVSKLFFPSERVHEDH